MSNTDYLEDKILNHVFRNTVYTPPATIYIGLFTAAPGESGGGTEVSGNGYARQAIAFAAPVTAGTISNSGTVTFPQATPAGWGTVTHWALFDASTSGNMLRQAPLTASKLVNAGDIFSFAVGSVVLQQD